MPPLVLTHTQRFKGAQPRSRMALMISERCRQSMQAKKVAPSTEWEAIKSNASKRNRGREAGLFSSLTYEVRFGIPGNGNVCRRA